MTKEEKIQKLAALYTAMIEEAIKPNGKSHRILEDYSKAYQGIEDLTEIEQVDIRLEVLQEVQNRILLAS